MLHSDAVYAVKPWLTSNSAARWFTSTWSVWMRFKSNMLKIVLSLPTCELFLYAWFMIIKGMQAYHDGFFCSQYVVKWFNCASLEVHHDDSEVHDQVMQYYVVKPWLTTHSASRWFRSTSVWMRFKSNMLKIVQHITPFCFTFAP